MTEAVRPTPSDPLRRCARDEKYSRSPVGAARRKKKNINLTAAELNALINERAGEALAAWEKYRNLNPPNQGANPNPPHCTFKTFLDCNPPSFNGTEGAAVSSDGLKNWNQLYHEQLMMKHKYFSHEKVQKLETEFRNHRMIGSEIEAYTSRSYELAHMCPEMVTPAYKHLEKYIEGLTPQVRNMVISADPTTLRHAVYLAHELTDTAVVQGLLPHVAQ
ncbi:hypothetical protein E3N88_01694 [Mikania micrantha]|uniref:Retrotransposon gag domain-containing protein n=1 Tax=Mikania micrantha TaxID=192012 RepID=A0A5N6Q408_9ASTR|nr:hypothetical protein E3N88_01694 [Mikania micrantha]